MNFPFFLFFLFFSCNSWYQSMMHHHIHAPVQNITSNSRHSECTVHVGVKYNTVFSFTIFAVGQFQARKH